MVERRLAAILMTDVVGSSRLIEADEGYALGAIKEILSNVLTATAQQYGGRLIKTMGDGALIEFASPVSAVSCAVTVQGLINDRASKEPEHRRILLRIGINLGDVVAQPDGDLYGDGVNVAARLEGIADPGGIAVSAKVHDELVGKVDFAFVDRGEQALKNIARPVRVFVLGGNGSAIGQSAISVRRPTLALSDKPSIAILPFANLSGDPEQDYFAEGVAEDITTALSRLRWLIVVARNADPTYKARTANVRQVGRDLGVRYTLEGSVRRAGGRLRITGQLIEAETGRPVWADRFDGQVEDVFDLQDRVTQAVAVAIEPSLRSAEIERVRRTPTESMDAYDLYLRALSLFYAGGEPGSVEALTLLARAVELDPAYDRAKAFAAMFHAYRFASWWGDDNREVEQGISLARQALQGEQDDAEALRAAGYAISYIGRDHVAGVAALDRALLLNGRTVPLLNFSARVRCYAEDWRGAVTDASEAMVLGPTDPETGFLYAVRSMAHFVGERYKEAAFDARRSIFLRPRYATAYRQLVSSLAHLNRMDEARAACQALIEMMGHRYSISSNRRRLPFSDLTITERFLSGLRRAGVSE